jgi:hypothetical protein
MVCGILYLTKLFSREDVTKQFDWHTEYGILKKRYGTATQCIDSCAEQYWVSYVDLAFSTYKGTESQDHVVF